jgi:hypothetical protein
VAGGVLDALRVKIREKAMMLNQALYLESFTLLLGL